MIIVDSHIHLGKCRVFEAEIRQEELLKAMRENNIEKAIVQPFPGAPDAIEVHNQIARLSREHPGKIYGVVSMNPHVGEEKYAREAIRCVKELGFVGLKLHTIGHAVNPLSEDGDLVFRIAAKLNVPVQVHTGLGIPFASPSLCIPCARKYPNLPIIITHAGFAILTDEAYVVAKECDNVFIETSWSISDKIKWLVDELGADRVMFGSDSLTNIPVELAKYRAIGLNEDQLERVLGKTAIKVFSLE